MKGKCKFFNTDKGFGFITGEDNMDYFIHITNIPQDMVLCENDEVIFDTEDGDKGPKAVNLTKE